MESIIDIGLWVSYIMVIIAIIGAVFLPIIKSLDNPKSLVKPAGALVGIVVLFLICYAFAGDGLNAKAIQAGVTGGISKFVGGGLIAMYVLFIVALVGIVFTEINKAIK
ncbi:hypothetical protein [Fulvivirga sp.]|jgi:hypothetical protein|uniref:hypothetical protein n=1 Tax=Fulvivirga sp. TaxID=1931237 RepID=UPI0032ED748A